LIKILDFVRLVRIEYSTTHTKKIVTTQHPKIAKVENIFQSLVLNKFFLVVLSTVNAK